MAASSAAAWGQIGEAQVRRDALRGAKGDHNLGIWQEGGWEWQPGSKSPSRVAFFPAPPPKPASTQKRTFPLRSPAPPLRDFLTGSPIDRRPTTACSRLVAVSTHFQGAGRAVPMFDVRQEAAPKIHPGPSAAVRDVASLATREPYLVASLPLGRGFNTALLRAPPYHELYHHNEVHHHYLPAPGAFSHHDQLQHPLSHQPQFAPASSSPPPRDLLPRPPNYSAASGITLALDAGPRTGASGHGIAFDVEAKVDASVAAIWVGGSAGSAGMAQSIQIYIRLGSSWGREAAPGEWKRAACHKGVLPTLRYPEGDVESRGAEMIRIEFDTPRPVHAGETLGIMIHSSLQHGIALQAYDGLRWGDVTDGNAAMLVRAGRMCTRSNPMAKMRGDAGDGGGQTALGVGQEGQDQGPGLVVGGGGGGGGGGGYPGGGERAGEPWRDYWSREVGWDGRPVTVEEAKRRCISFNPYIAFDQPRMALTRGDPHFHSFGERRCIHPGVAGFAGRLEYALGLGA